MASMQVEKLQVVEEEISLRDIVRFLKRAWKFLVVGGAAGLFIVLAYVVINKAPEKYQAVGQIRMATTKEGNNIEEPEMLVERLRLPTAFPIEVRQDCGMPEGGEFGEYLGGLLEIKPSKNVKGIAEVTISAGDANQSKGCVSAIVKMIIGQQQGLIEAQFAVQNELITRYRKLLAEEQQKLEKIKRAELSVLSSAGLLGNLSWLNSRINSLQEELATSKAQPAKLISPIYASGKPVRTSSNVDKVWFGVFLGLVFGALSAFVLEAWRKSA